MTMPKITKPTESVPAKRFIEGAAVDMGVADIASFVYKDRSGAKLGGGVSEGKANFGAVTAEAIKTVADEAAKAAAVA